MEYFLQCSKINLNHRFLLFNIAFVNNSNVHDKATRHPTAYFAGGSDFREFLEVLVSFLLYVVFSDSSTAIIFEALFRSKSIQVTIVERFLTMPFAGDGKQRKKSLFFLFLLKCLVLPISRHGRQTKDFKTLN